MNKREPIKTTVREAVAYWSRRVDECGLSVDWSEADTHCWRCGCEEHLQRCHIVPHALGGKDEPGNIVLLCSRCHGEGPNVTDPEIMWDWIRAYAVPFYGTFWSIMGRKEYRMIYGRSLGQELAELSARAGVREGDKEGEKRLEEMVRSSLQSVSQEMSRHFGQAYFNSATIAGMYRMMLKETARAWGLPFPAEEERPRENPEQPWWLDV